MAKGKRSRGKNYTSKGERSNVAGWVRRAMRKDYMQSWKELSHSKPRHIIKAKKQ